MEVAQSGVENGGIIARVVGDGCNIDRIMARVAGAEWDVSTVSESELVFLVVVSPDTVVVEAGPAGENVCADSRDHENSIEFKVTGGAVLVAHGDACLANLGYREWGTIANAYAAFRVCASCLGDVVVVGKAMLRGSAVNKDGLIVVIERESYIQGDCTL